MLNSPTEPASLPRAASSGDDSAPDVDDQLFDDDAIAECWQRGELAYKVLPYQQTLYDDIKLQLWGDGGYRNPTGRHRKYIPEIHRKFGKSYVAGIIALELGLQKPGAAIIWGAETQKQVQLFLIPIMNELLADCPAALRPVFVRSAGAWVFGNGSRIIVGGCEDEAKCDRLRGPSCDLFIADEAGQIRPLHYLYTSVVLWMISRSGGRVLMPSTPATTPGHPFTAFCILAEAGESGYAKRTVHDSCFSLEQLAELARECGGTDTPQWRREALCDRVVDALRAIVGEFTPREHAIVRPDCMRCGADYADHALEHCHDGGAFQWAHETIANDNGETRIGPPEYRDCYASADPGWHPDLFAVIFGYWAFRRAVLVIEDELEFSQPTTQDVADGIKAVEDRLWSAYFERLRREHRPDDAEPYKRVSDTEPQIIFDLTKLHGVSFVGTRKDDKEAQVNEARLFCKALKLAIHPRCKRLIAHLKAGIWNQRRTSYEHIAGFGHFDFIDALVYLIRNVDRQHNPFPAVPYSATTQDHWVRPNQPEPIPEHLRGWSEAFARSA